MGYGAAHGPRKRRSRPISTAWPGVISTSGRTSLPGSAADQALTEQIARLFAAANTQVASAIQAAQGGTVMQPRAGTPSAAASSGHGVDDVGELRKRVEALEARIAELRSKLRGA